MAGHLGKATWVLPNPAMNWHRCAMPHRPDRDTPGPAPTEATLRDTALSYLARFAATEAGVRQVLDRRISRWARSIDDRGDDRDSATDQVAAAKQAAVKVVAGLVASGVLNDAEFAAGKARGLLRSGLSRRAIAARLATKGVNAEIAQSVLPNDPDTELAAALTLARRRRIGPFRMGEAPDAAARQREMAILARAGFTRDAVNTAMAMSHEDAEAMILAPRN